MKKLVIFLWLGLCSTVCTSQLDIDSLISDCKERKDSTDLLNLLNDSTRVIAIDTLAQIHRALGVINYKHDLLYGSIGWSRSALVLHYSQNSVDSLELAKTLKNLILFNDKALESDSVIKYSRILSKVDCSSCESRNYYGWYKLVEHLMFKSDYFQALDIIELWKISGLSNSSRELEMSWFEFKAQYKLGKLSGLDLTQSLRARIEKVTNSIEGKNKYRYTAAGLLQLAVFLDGQGDYGMAGEINELAIEYIIKYRQVFQTEEPEYRQASIALSEAYSNLGGSLLRQGRIVEAEEMFEVALELQNALFGKEYLPVRSALLDNIREMHKKQGNDSMALKFCFMSLSNLIGRQIENVHQILEDDVAKARNNVKMLLYLSNLIELMSKSVSNDEIDTFIALTSRIELFTSSILRSQTTISGKRVWMQDVSRTLLSAFEVLCKENIYNESLRIAEKSKSLLALSHLQKKGKSCQSDSISKNLYRIDSTLIALEYRKIRASDNERTDLVKEIVKNNLLREKLMVQGSTSGCINLYNIYDNWNLEYLKKLSLEKPIVYFVWGNSSISRFIIQESKIEIEVIDKSVVESDLQVVLNGLRDVQSSTEYEISLTRLSEHLIGTSLPDASSILISPDGPLSALPFEILRYDDMSLVDLSEIGYVYSIGVYKYCTEQLEEKNETILSVAPFIGSQSRSGQNESKTLYFSAREVEEINKQFGGEFLSMTSATRDSFLALAPNYGILHLATHAVVDDENVDFSCIYFQPEEGDSLANRLYLNDLYAMNLPLEMVVLSACETGVGKLLKGEGMLSLANGFTQAGAKSVITSLWKADDESTYKIMTAFYKYLARGQRKDEALRNAKLEYLENCDPLKSSPYYWAAFIPIGDMSPIRAKPLYLQWGFWLMIGVAVLGVWGYRRHLIDCKKAA